MCRFPTKAEMLSAAAAIAKPLLLGVALALLCTPLLTGPFAPREVAAQAVLDTGCVYHGEQIPHGGIVQTGQKAWDGQPYFQQCHKGGWGVQFSLHEIDRAMVYRSRNPL